jgi:hypothetical protein
VRVAGHRFLDATDPKDRRILSGAWSQSVAEVVAQ